MANKAATPIPEATKLDLATKVEGVKVEELPGSSGSSQDFSCSICSTKFHLRNDLLKHFLQHGNNEIDYNGRPKALEVTVPKTVSSSGGDAKTTMIQCEWCPDKFKDISRAIQHKHRKHANILVNYYCEYCGKQFPLRISLIRHQFTCSEQKEASADSNCLPIYNCILCEARFMTAAAKATHEKNTHFASIPTTIVPPPSKKIRMSNNGEWCSLYYCHLCGAEYSMKHNLKKHLENYHTLEERTKFPSAGIIKCKLCDALFHTKNAYLVHNLHHSKDDIYVNSEKERLQMVHKVDQDLDLNRIHIPTTMKLTSKGQIPKKYLHLMPSVKVNLTPLSTKDFHRDEQNNENN
ncbi:zinc finger protein 473-like [Lutzomyia longipalpis]|uniref:zinc finger protein 473-like n=1 Tax=Lutzomyia longipalpis TaxID=7200 RepID=UPI002483698A|nr:zinc finger protein 473-like [Lutzomyia longipalpis]